MIKRLIVGVIAGLIGVTTVQAQERFFSFGGDATEATQLLNMVELVRQTQTAIEQLRTERDHYSNVSELGDRVLELLDLEGLDAIREYAPKTFRELMAALEGVAPQAIADILDVLDSIETVFSYDPKTDTLYRTILRDTAAQAGYAEASYNASAETIEAIEKRRDAISGMDRQIDRDVANSALQAETAIAINRLIQLQAASAKAEAQKRAADLAAQEAYHKFNTGEVNRSGASQ